MIDMMTKKCPGDKQSQEYNKWTVEIEKMAFMIEDRVMSRDVRACSIYLNVRFYPVLSIRKEQMLLLFTSYLY